MYTRAGKRACSSLYSQLSPYHTSHICQFNFVLVKRTICNPQFKFSIQLILAPFCMQMMCEGAACFHFLYCALFWRFSAGHYYDILHLCTHYLKHWYMLISLYSDSEFNIYMLQLQKMLHVRGRVDFLLLCVICTDWFHFDPYLWFKRYMISARLKLIIYLYQKTVQLS